MPDGYYLAYVAKEDVPYWHYVIGQGPKANNVAGTIPKGGLVHLQRPPDNLGTHQSAVSLRCWQDHCQAGRFPTCSRSVD